MSGPNHLPAGESLPEYEDERHTDAHVIQAYLRQHVPGKWGDASLGGTTPAEALHASAEVGDHALAMYERELITDVIGALLATGDATLVKNATYRAMVRDGREIERLAAGLTKAGVVELLVANDGNPVTTALEVVAQARAAAEQWTEIIEAAAREWGPRDA